MAEKVSVEVAYALPHKQWVLPVTVDSGATVAECIDRSGIADQAPDLVARDGQVGIFGKTCRLDSPVKDGDRIEIYRPLNRDPKELRRERARQQSGDQGRLKKR